MINSATLHKLLKEIYGVDDKYIIPLNESEWVPTVKDDTVETWLGYRMLSIQPYARAYTEDHYVVIPIASEFRVTFIGEQAEEFACHTMFWDIRRDVVKAFEKYQIQLNYKGRKIYTRPVKEEGLDDRMCWVVEFSCQTYYVEDTGWPLWHLSEDQIKIGGDLRWIK